MSAFYPAEILQDGYTEEGEIEEVPGLFPRVQFKFRPAIDADYLKLLPQATGDYESVNDTLARHIAWWDIKDGDELAPITPEMFRRMKQGLKVKLRNIVAGLEPPKPTAPAPDRDADRKNSTAA